MTYLLLAVGLVLLAFGGDMMVNGAVCLARRMGVSTLLIGLTLVGFGTSTPELVSSLVAIIQGSGGIAAGNVVGSNIANILLVLGAAALIAPVRVDAQSFRRDGVFLVVATVMLLMCVVTGHVGRLAAVVLVGILVAYVVYSYISDRRQQARQVSPDAAAENKNISLPISLARALGGIAITILGARLLVDNAIILARAWGVAESIIGLTVVAVGTSLPELATSVMSSIRGHNDVAFGNVVGSNIYNALFILGVTALFVPVTVPSGMGLDAVIMTVVTAVMIGIALWRGRFSRMTGAMFLAAYAVYTCWLYMAA